MKYSKENIAAVEDRILEYMQAIEAYPLSPGDTARNITGCAICMSTWNAEGDHVCGKCLLANNKTKHRSIFGDCISTLRDSMIIEYPIDINRLKRRLAEMLESINKNLESE